MSLLGHLKRQPACSKTPIRLLWFIFLFAELLPVVANAEDGDEVEGRTTLSPTAAPRGQSSHGAIIGAVVGGISLALLCLAGCYGQHKEFLYELRMRR